MRTLIGYCRRLYKRLDCWAYDRAKDRFLRQHLTADEYEMTRRAEAARAEHAH